MENKNKKQKTTKTLTFFQLDDNWKLPPTRSNIKKQWMRSMRDILKSEEKDLVY